MSNFISNPWVISIVSGILVFFITNIYIMFHDKKQRKRKIIDANSMVLKNLRSYVVDNLPSKEIIIALKSSIAREYDLKYEDLLTTKSVCEDLIRDIIGNIYVSNDNKKKYLSMLQEFLNHNNESNNNTKIIASSKANTKINSYISVSATSSIFTFLGTFFSINTMIGDPSDVIIGLYRVSIFICVLLMTTISIFLQIRKNKKTKK